MGRVRPRVVPGIRALPGVARRASGGRSGGDLIGDYIKKKEIGVRMALSQDS